MASSNIKSIGYDSNRETLEIEFTAGSVFQYFDIPQATYEEIISSSSVGGYFHNNIKNKYTHTKLLDFSFREMELVSYLYRLIEANNDFSNVILEPGFKGIDGRMLRPDIVCDYQNKKLIVEVKKSVPLTDSRVVEFIKQVKSYKVFGDDTQLVVVFPVSLQKKYEEQFKSENILVWDISTLATIFSSEIEIIRETPLYPIIFNAGVKKEAKSQSVLFIEELKSIKSGREEWSKYQKLIANCMEYLFAPPLGKPLYELSDSTKTNRRDIILPNYSEGGFWQFLRDNYFAHFIVIDAKNLTKHIEKKDVLQVSNYLKKFGTGLFGMIISRNNPHSNAILTQREHWIADNKLVVFLQDEDIVQMLTMKDSSGNPEDVIRQKIEDFRLSL
ncbi:hypothetical protein A9Q81_13655 [Gammaproteobacteria bacterium 42_54_T18]|nr:hypothetical protein A9Q81_13655 [Gammaproteobacteria bacterium 42_54_T18]